MSHFLTNIFTKCIFCWKQFVRWAMLNDHNKGPKKSATIVEKYNAVKLVTNKDITWYHRWLIHLMVIGVYLSLLQYIFLDVNILYRSKYSPVFKENFVIKAKLHEMIISLWSSNGKLISNFLRSYKNLITFIQSPSLLLSPK